MPEPKEKYDVCVLGSCMVDFISYMPALPRSGETVIGNSFEHGYGGKGANQCVAAAKLGSNTVLVAKVGKDQWGQHYKDHLESFNVNTTCLQLADGMTTGIAQIHVANNGENQIVIVAGANNELSIEDAAAARPIIDQSKVLVCQGETPLKTSFAAMRSYRGISILNVSPVPNENSLEIYTLPTVLCVNELEAAAMTNREVPDMEEAKRALNNFLCLGSKIAIITLGKNGAIFATADDSKVIHVKAPPNVEAIDTTGAGDAFLGALAHFMATEPNVPLVQKVGAACMIGSMSVTKKGTQPSYPTLSELGDFSLEKKTFEWSYLD